MIIVQIRFLGSFRTGRYQGPNTTFEFANGTIWSQMNVAVVIKNFTGVDSGTAFFQKFCSGPQPPSAAPASAPPGNNTTPSTPANAPKPSHIGYPKAELINSDLAVGGYFLDGSAYQVRSDYYTLYLSNFDRMSLFSASRLTKPKVLKLSKILCVSGICTN